MKIVKNNNKKQEVHAKTHDLDKFTMIKHLLSSSSEEGEKP